MLVDALLDAATSLPRKVAAADPTRELTFGQLATFAKAVRRLVLAESRCERVGVVLPASAGTLGTILGIQWAGKTPIPINFLLQPRELAAVLADAQLDLILSVEHFEPMLAPTGVRTLYLERLNLKRRYFWEKLRPTPDPPDVSPDDVAAILYTSGTTGLPKGVCLTYGNFVSNARAAIEHMRIAPDAELLGIIPPFHVFGLSVTVFLPVVLGATVHYIPRFSPQATYKTIRERGVTVLMAVPSMYAAVARLKSVEPDAFKRIHIAASGGEPLPRTVYDLFHERTGVRLIEGYGLTETSPIISADLPWAHKVGTVGPPLPGVELEVRDDAGVPVGAGVDGELFVRGPGIMKGYYRKPEETAAVIDADGWFRTGDIVRIDDDGYIKITGRAKDLIIVAGENVYPREVEAVLEQHPAVAESAVVGQPDGSRGEVVVGFVTARDGTTLNPDELRGFCKQYLAGFKVPRHIHVRDELPHGPTGKVLKRELKAMLETQPVS